MQRFYTTSVSINGEGAFDHIFGGQGKKIDLKGSRVVCVLSFLVERACEEVFFRLSKTEVWSLQVSRMDPNFDGFQRVTVTAPACCANLGPGYDCLGLTIDLWNTVEVTRSEEFRVTIEGEGADILCKNSSNEVLRAASYAFYKACEKDLQSTLTLHFHCSNKIPIGRGLGSSAAAIVCGLLAGFFMGGNKKLPSLEELLMHATYLEGHPDNVAPALYGGMCLVMSAEGIETILPQVTRREDTRISPLFCQPICLAQEKISCILVVPNFEANTKESRQLLPNVVNIKDAVFNVTRASLLVYAFASGNLNLLRVGMQDRFHQDLRMQTQSHVKPLISKALETGAYGACLSGSGPSVLIISPQDEEIRCKLKASLLQVVEELVLDARIFDVAIPMRGAIVTSSH